MKTSREKQIEKWLDECAKENDWDNLEELKTANEDVWDCLMIMFKYVTDKQHEADEKWMNEQVKIYENEMKGSVYHKGKWIPASKLLKSLQKEENTRKQVAKEIFDEYEREWDKKGDNCYVDDEVYCKLKKKYLGKEE
jgi:cytochrome oxidase Cu insertion factor (SCO1/SenC/PrrC family)